MPKPDLASLQASLAPKRAAPALSESKAPPAYYVPPSRVGKRHVALWLPLAVWRTLRTLAMQRDTSMQGLLEEAVADMLRKYGAPASD